MKIFKEKTPYDIPDLKNANIETIVKKAIAGNNYIVPPPTLQQVYDLGTTPQTCASVIIQLLKIYDDMGSHPIPVYKSLIILLFLLKSGSKNYINVARALVPEIQTVLYLSFGEKRVTFRDQIHLMASAIYNFLMYEAPLPDAGDFHDKLSGNTNIYKRPPPPQPQEENISLSAVARARKRPQPTEEEDDELPFDPRALKKEVRNSFNPFSSHPTLLEPPPPPEPAPAEAIFNDPIPEVITVPSAPIETYVEPEPVPVETEPELKDPTAADIMFINQLKLITKTQYDSTIESC